MVDDLDFEMLKTKLILVFNGLHREKFEKKIVDRTIDASMKFLVHTGRIPTSNQIETWFHLLESVKPDPIYAKVSMQYRERCISAVTDLSQQE